MSTSERDPNAPFSMELLAKFGETPKDMPHSLTKDDARQILVHEQQRDAVGFSYDDARDVVTICGTEFSRAVLAQFRADSGEDLCYQHQRSDRGAVIVRWQHGHRARIQQLVACLQARPSEAPVSSPEWLAWHEAATITLNTHEDQIAEEARAIENLIVCARGHRLSCRELEGDTAQIAAERQMKAAALLWHALERVQFIRSRLFLWSPIEEPAPPANA